MKRKKQNSLFQFTSVLAKSSKKLPPKAPGPGQGLSEAKSHCGPMPGWKLHLMKVIFACLQGAERQMQAREAEVFHQNKVKRNNFFGALHLFSFQQESWLLLLFSVECREIKHCPFSMAEKKGTKLMLGSPHLFVLWTNTAQQGLKQSLVNWAKKAAAPPQVAGGLESRGDGIVPCTMFCKIAGAQYEPN